MSVQTCHATQANYEHCKYSTNRGWCDTSRYAELFGTPERAARTLVERLNVGVLEWCNNDCDNCPYEYDPYGCEQDITLLEWLRSDTE